MQNNNEPSKLWIKKDCPSYLTVHHTLNELHIDKHDEAITIDLTEAEQLTHLYVHDVPHCHVIPSDLSHIKSLRVFSCPLDHMVTFNNPHLDCIALKGIFDFPLDLSNVPSLKILSLGDAFNHPLDLPEHDMPLLSLGDRFNQPIRTSNAIFIRTLRIGNSFNQSLPSHLDFGVLDMGHGFNQPLDLRRYQTIRVNIGNGMNQPLYLSDKIEMIRMGHGFNQPLQDLSHALETLTLGDMFNQYLNMNQTPNLTNLRLGHGFNQPLDLRSTSVYYLSIGNGFNQPLHAEHVMNIELGHGFNQPLDFQGMEKLNITIGDKFNQPMTLNDVNMNQLKLGNGFNSLLNLNRSEIGHLELGNSFNMPLDLSTTLIRNVLILGHAFNQPLDGNYSQRRFGSVHFATRSSPRFQEKLDSLGHDLLQENPLEQTEVVQLFRRKPKQNICTRLLDQSVLAGVGNYMKCEALYRLALNPHSCIHELSDHTLYELYCLLREIAEQACQSGGATLGTYTDMHGRRQRYQFQFQVYGLHTDPKGNPVEKIQTPDKRTTQWVPAVQKRTR